GAIVYMAVVVVNKPINVTPTVTVQVEIPRVVQDAAVVLILDGKEVSKEDLARPVSLKTGEHELVTKQGGKEGETYKCNVGKDDKTIHLESADVEASEDVKELIEALLKDKDATVRFDAAEGLQHKGATCAVPALIEALEDKVSIVRFGAAESLRKLGDPR